MYWLNLQRNPKKKGNFPNAVVNLERILCLYWISASYSFPYRRTPNIVFILNWTRMTSNCITLMSFELDLFWVPLQRSKIDRLSHKINLNRCLSLEVSWCSRINCLKKSSSLILGLDFWIHIPHKYNRFTFVGPKLARRSSNFSAKRKFSSLPIFLGAGDEIAILSLTGYACISEWLHSDNEFVNLDEAKWCRLNRPLCKLAIYIQESNPKKKYWQFGISSSQLDRCPPSEFAADI